MAAFMNYHTRESVFVRAEQLENNLKERSKMNSTKEKKKLMNNNISAKHAMKKKNEMSDFIVDDDDDDNEMIQDDQNQYQVQDEYNGVGDGDDDMSEIEGIATEVEELEEYERYLIEDEAMEEDLISQEDNEDSDGDIDDDEVHQLIKDAMNRVITVLGKPHDADGERNKNH